MAMVKWTDIIGHKQEIAYLRQMLGADRLPHALLFCGSNAYRAEKIEKVDDVMKELVGE